MKNGVSYPASRTLQIAQSLYERHKVITYPRTDSKALPEDYGPTCKDLLGSIQGELAPHAQKALQSNWVDEKNKKIFNNKQIKHMLDFRILIIIILIKRNNTKITKTTIITNISNITKNKTIRIKITNNKINNINNKIKI